jgi:hypothetical protein
VRRNQRTFAGHAGEGFHRQSETKKSREETVMAYETIEVRKTTPTIGAEIFGVDLSRQLSKWQFDEIHQAFDAGKIGACPPQDNPGAKIGGGVGGRQAFWLQPKPRRYCALRLPL